MCTACTGSKVRKKRNEKKKGKMLKNDGKQKPFSHMNSRQSMLLIMSHFSCSPYFYLPIIMVQVDLGFNLSKDFSRTVKALLDVSWQSDLPFLPQFRHLIDCG